MKSLDPLRAKKTFIRKKLGHTAVSAIKASSVTILKDTILASFDIESLYSNIPHNLGLEAVKYWIEKYPDTLNSRFSKEFILDGIKLILENNIFCFNDTFYRQEKGTAMGTKFAPVYATLTIGY